MFDGLSVWDKVSLYKYGKILTEYTIACKLVELAQPNSTSPQHMIIYIICGGLPNIRPFLLPGIRGHCPQEIWRKSQEISLRIRSYGLERIWQDIRWRKKIPVIRTKLREQKQFLCSWTNYLFQEQTYCYRNLTPDKHIH